MEALLTSLVRKEVLSFQTDPRSSERGQFGFLQDLVKRVAYETLSKKERKARHLAVAEYLESSNDIHAVVAGMSGNRILDLFGSALHAIFQARVRVMLFPVSRRRGIRDIAPSHGKRRHMQRDRGPRQSRAHTLVVGHGAAHAGPCTERRQCDHDWAGMVGAITVE